MTLFQLVKIAIDVLYKDALKQYGSQADSVIKENFEYLRLSYGGLTNPNREPINYRDPATRFAYVYSYVATHGDYLVQLLALASQKLDKVFHSDTARVSCIGGGPGSDVIAILKYLNDFSEKESVKKLIVYLLDKEQAWADSWTELDHQLDATVSLSTNFQPFDVTKPESWSLQRKFLDSDLFTLSYFVSEVYSLDGNGVVMKFWDTLFSEAKPGAIFIYDDNGYGDFNNYFDLQWKRHDIELIRGETNVRWTPRYTEQANVLDEYKAKFSSSPKLQGYLSYRILRKKI